MRSHTLVAWVLLAAVIAALGTVSGSASAGGDQRVYPEAPADLRVTDASQQSLTAAWSAVSGASGYRVGRNGVALTDTGGTSYTWTGLTCGTGYTLSVQSETSTHDKGGQVATVSGTTASCDTPASTDAAQSSDTVADQGSSSGSSSGSSDQPANLPAPADLHVTDASRQTSLSAAWSAVSGASGYRVGRNGVALTDTGGTSYTWTGLTCGTTYKLSVQSETSTHDTAGQAATVSGTTASCDPPASTDAAQSSDTVADQGSSSGSSSGSGDQPANLPAPADLHVTDASRQTSLSAAWSAVSGASGYRVGLNGVALADTGGTSYTWTGLTCGTTYKLSVQSEASAHDTAGQVATVSGTTASCGTSGGGAASQPSATVADQVTSGNGQQAYPGAPADLVVTDASRQTSLTAVWGAVGGASGYRVGRNGVALTDTAKTSYTWTGLTCGTTYTLSVQPETSTHDTGGRVAAVSGTTANCGAWSTADAVAEAVGQTGALQVYPSAPADLHITDVSQQTSLTAVWSAVSGASGYRVGRNGVALIDTGRTSYTWTGLTCGTTYKLSIQPEASAHDMGGQVAAVSGTTASCDSSGGANGGSSGGVGGTSAAFKGDFENGSISQWKSTSWGGAQCLNYGATSGSISRGDLHIVADSATKGSYTGRFDLPAAGTNNACELLRGRTIGMDDEWYSMEVRFPSDWREPSPAGWGMSLAQFNYERIWGAPLGITAHSDYVGLNLNSGLCVPITAGNPSCQYSSGIAGNVPSQDIIPPSDFSTGDWHELLIHVKWTNGHDGVVEGFHRLHGQTEWTRTVRFSGYPTLQRTSTFTPVASDRTVDKIGAYRGAAGFPLSVWQGSFCQTASRAAAESCF